MEHKRILLKLSGEVLAGDQPFGIALPALAHYVDEIAKVHEAGIGMTIVIGGGNICRGSQLSSLGIGKVPGDHMGMLATMINAIALHTLLSQRGLPARLMSRLSMHRIAEGYSTVKANHHLDKGRIVIIGGGTSNPCFTTDSAASLTAVEVGADTFVKGTQVAGVYSGDPKKDRHAKLYTDLSLQEALDKRLGVMDMTAIMLCIESKLSVIVYDATKPGQLLRVLQEKSGGTFLHV